MGLLKIENNTISRVKTCLAITLFLLLCLNRAIAQDHYNAVFQVYSNQEPIEGAEVFLDGYQSQSTNSNGEAVFTDIAPTDSLFYSVAKIGYLPFSDSIKVTNGPVSEIVNLELETWRVQFNLTSDDDDFSMAEVTLDDYGTKTTDNAGVAIFEDVTYAEERNYSITANGFEPIEGTLTRLQSDTIITHEMVTKGYKVLFKVSSKGDPVEDATITFSDLPQQNTNTEGEALFVGLSSGSNLPFTIVKQGFSDYTGTLSINNQNVVMPISIYGLSYSVTFTVILNNSPVLGAKVEIDQTQTNYTDNFGIARFSNIEGQIPHQYKISKSGIESQSGTFTISSDTTLTFNVIIGGVDSEESQVKIFPNPAHETFRIVVKTPSTITILSLKGEILRSFAKVTELVDIYTETLNPGLYVIQITNNQSTSYHKLIIQ